MKKLVELGKEGIAISGQEYTLLEIVSKSVVERVTP
jgi:hypothetical protein